MKNKTSRLLALVMATLFVAALLSGCAAKDQTILVAEVGDYKINLATLKNLYLSNVDYASYYGMDLTTTEGVEAFQDMLLDSAVSTKVRLYQAELAGITLTDEEKAEAAVAAEEGYNALVESYVSAAKENGSTEPEVTAKKYLTDMLASNGLTIKKLKEEYLTNELDSRLIEKHRAELEEAATPTAEEIQAAYEKELEEQTVSFTESPSMYFSYEQYFAYGLTCMPLMVPSGLFNIRHILVEDKALADELYTRIQNGEDFKALMDEFGTDPGMKESESYLCGAGANFVAPFLEAALKLEKEGDFTEPVESEYGYHIIQRLDDVKAGPIDYDTISEQFASYITAKLKEESYTNLVNEWMEGDYVYRYPDNYRHLGMDGVVPAEEAAEDATEAPAA